MIQRIVLNRAIAAILTWRIGYRAPFMRFVNIRPETEWRCVRGFIPRRQSHDQSIFDAVVRCYCP